MRPTDGSAHAACALACPGAHALPSLGHPTQAHVPVRRPAPIGDESRTAEANDHGSRTRRHTSLHRGAHT